MTLNMTLTLIKVKLKLNIVKVRELLQFVNLELIVQNLAMNFLLRAR